MYFFDIWNYSDQMYIWSGYANLYIQADFKENHEHYTPVGKTLMIFFSIMMLIKTFFFMRIFEKFTKLVIMIKNVIADL